MSVVPGRSPGSRPTRRRAIHRERASSGLRTTASPDKKNEQRQRRGGQELKRLKCVAVWQDEKVAGPECDVTITGRTEFRVSGLSLS